VLYMVVVAATLIIGDAVGFGGHYRQIVGQELRVVNPFKRTKGFPSARTNGRPSSIKVARRPW
jgi:hypothetical protein